MPAIERSHKPVETILRAYGIDHPTQAERRAYAAVLDRMGAFAATERDTLCTAGILDAERN